MHVTRTHRPQALATVLVRLSAAMLTLLWLSGCAVPVAAPADAARTSPSKAPAVQVASPSPGGIPLPPGATSSTLGLPTEAPCPPACTPTPNAPPQPTRAATAQADPQITSHPLVTALLAALRQQELSFSLEGPS